MLRKLVQRPKNNLQHHDLKEVIKVKMISKPVSSRVEGIPDPHTIHAAVVGGGPAGLIAADVLSAAGLRVSLFDAMASVGRKFLLAGKGGLNLTHSEPLPDFLRRYREASDWVAPWLRRFPPEAMRAFAARLGVDTFVGSSGRVFPVDMKAGPLMRRWVQRLREQGVSFRVRHRFEGWDDEDRLRLHGPEGPCLETADVTLLALGGASWAKLGSDGRWAAILQAQGVALSGFEASNCGFECHWSAHFRERHQGAPLKRIAARVAGHSPWQRGEAMLTAEGIEGSLVYALSQPLRSALRENGEAVLELDLLPERDLESLIRALAEPRKGRSRSEHWRRRIGLSGAKAGLLLEYLPETARDDPQACARLIKALPLRLQGTRPMDEAISTAGGVRREAVTADLMLKARPGVFVAGEMLDWDAPTGGYLLTACMASGVVAAEGMLSFVGARPHAL